MSDPSNPLEKSEYQIQSIGCPACENEEAKVVTHILDIPYYDDFLMMTISCTQCGYRSHDFRNMEVKSRMKMTYSITEESDDVTKVVRAREGSVKIPELGVAIEPMNDSTTWIRNIEGILEDIKGKLLISKHQSEDEKTINAVNERIKKLHQFQQFKEPFTIIVDDPSGNSLILPAEPEKLMTEKFEDEEPEEDDEESE